MSAWPSLNTERDRRIVELRRKGTAPKQIRFILVEFYPTLTVNVIYKVLERRSGKDRRNLANPNP